MSFWGLLQVWPGYSVLQVEGLQISWMAVGGRLTSQLSDQWLVIPEREAAATSVMSRGN